MAQNPYQKIYDDLSITISQQTTFDEAQSIAVHLGYIYNTFGLMVKDFINLLGYRFKADQEGTKGQGSRSGRKEGGWEGKGEQTEGDEVMEGKWAKGAPNRLIKQISSLSREGSREVSEKVLRQKLLKLRQQKDPIDKETMVNENRDNDRSRNGENPIKKIRMRRHRQVVCEVIDISSEDEQKEEQMSEEEERRMRTRSHVRGHSNDAAVSNGNNNNNINTQNNTNKTSHRGRGRRGRGRGRPARVISQSQSNEDPFQIIYNVPYKRHKMQQPSIRNDKDSSNHSMTDNYNINKKQQLQQKKAIKSAQNLSIKSHQHQYKSPSFLNKVMTSYVQSKQALNHSRQHLDRQSPKQSIKQRIQRLQRQYQEEERIRERMYERINHQNNHGHENDGKNCSNNSDDEDNDKNDDNNGEQYEQEMQLEDNNDQQADNRSQEFSLGQAIDRYIVPFHQITHSNHNNNKNPHNQKNQDNNNNQQNNNNKQTYLQLINQSIQQQYEENLAIDQQYEYDHESQPQSQQPQMSQPSEQDYISHHELSFHPSQDQFGKQVAQNQPLNSDKPQQRQQQRPQQTLSQQFEVQRQKQPPNNHKQHATLRNQHKNIPSSQQNDMNYELLGQGQLNRSNDSYEKVMFDSFQKNDAINSLQNCQNHQQIHYSSQIRVNKEKQNGKERNKSIESINQKKNMVQNGHSNHIVHQRAQHTLQQDKEQVLRVLQEFSDQQHQHQLKPHHQNHTQVYASQTLINLNPTPTPTTTPNTPHLITTSQTHPTSQHILPTAPNRLQLNKFTKKNQKHIEIIQLE